MIQSNTCTSAVSCLSFSQFVILIYFLVSFYRTPFLFSHFFSTSPDIHNLILSESFTWGIFYFLHYTAKPIWAGYRLVLSIYRILFTACHYYPSFSFFGICVLYFPTLVDWIIRKIFSSFSVKKLEHCNIVCSRSFSYRILSYCCSLVAFINF